jgi:hypothetical protein
MQNKFVADGPFRFLRGKNAALSESVEKKYAAEPSSADPQQKFQIRKRMAEEYLRREKNEGHKPSPGTLW